MPTLDRSALEAHAAYLQAQLHAVDVLLGRATPSRRVAAPAKAATAPPNRRKMNRAQKAAVSVRMKAYWAKKRAGKKTS